jgi:hypothetical protein
MCYFMLAGCSMGGMHHGASSEVERGGVSASPVEGIRRDEAVVSKYFPEFGHPKSVAWAGDVLGDGRSGVPGPSDVRISGVVWLSDFDAARIQHGYTWRPTPSAPDVVNAVQDQVPESSEWQSSEDFHSEVTERGRYFATFAVDFTRKVLVFNARNPEKKTSSPS